MNSVNNYISIWKSKLKQKSKIDKEKDLNLLLKYPTIQSLLQKHQEITRDQLERNYHQLMLLVQEQQNCQKCPGLESCPNMMKGHYPTLNHYAGYLELRMAPCTKKMLDDQQKKQKELFRSLYIPTEIISASLEQIDLTMGRMRALKAASEFCKQFSQNTFPNKGIYLYGPLGVGKSMIAAGIANKLVENGIDSFMVYVPDFIREVRNSIEDKTLGEKIDLFKSISLLILDDIGAEYLTPWIRDEVLGAILHYRAANGYPTIYTSNLTLDELEDHLARTKDSYDEMKGKRIMERIRYFVTPILVEGPNRRVDK